MAQILRDTNTKVPKWLNNMETSSRQGYETPTKAPAPSERRAELARVLVLSTDHLQVVHSFKAPSTTGFLTLRTSHRAGGATR